MTPSELPTASATDLALPTRRLGRHLLTLLKKELVLQHRLLAAATQIREAIIERDIPSLSRVQQRYQELLDEAEQAAAERVTVSRVIARAGGVPPAQITLSRVAACCPGDVALLIGAAREMLLEVASQVHDTQLLNRELLENELDYIGASLEVLARALAPRKDYSAPMQRLGTPAILLDKAA